MSAQAVVRDDGVVALGGQLTFDTVPALLPNAVRWFETNPNGVTIDLGGVTLADSAGLALMIEWLAQARKAGREVRYVNIPEQVRHLIDVSSLREAFGLTA